MEIETDIIDEIAPSPIGITVVLVIMHVETFQTGVIVLNRERHNAFNNTLTDIFFVSIQNQIR